MDASSLLNCQKQFLNLLYPPPHRSPSLTQTQKTMWNTRCKFILVLKRWQRLHHFFGVSFSLPCSLVLKPVANRSCSLWNQNEEEEEEVIKLSVFKEKDFFSQRLSFACSFRHGHADSCCATGRKQSNIGIKERGVEMKSNGHVVYQSKISGTKYLFMADGLTDDHMTSLLFFSITSFFFALHRFW